MTEQKLNIDDYRCTICCDLMYEPTTLECSHSFCRACLALNSLNSVKCPNCRSEVLVRPPFPLDARLQSLLRKSFPKEYEARELDNAESKEAFDKITPLIVGNLYYELKTTSSNKNNWCFYIRDPAGKPLDWIEKVVVDLHPTFNPPKVTLTKEPFEVNRIGWGTFQIEATIHLKESAFEKLQERTITVEHMLVFQGKDNFKPYGFDIGKRIAAPEVKKTVSRSDRGDRKSDAATAAKSVKPAAGSKPAAAASKAGAGAGSAAGAGAGAGSSRSAAATSGSRSAGSSASAAGSSRAS